MSAVDFNVELNEVVSKKARANEDGDIYQDSLTINLMPEEESGEGQQRKMRPLRMFQMECMCLR